MEVVIEGVNLPGRSCGAAEGYDNVHVGVQRGKEVVELHSGDAASARWGFELVDRDLPDGTVDFGGPFVQGRRGDRFVYLSWGTVDGDGGFTMFRRAKLMLAAVDGTPRCAAVRPPGIDWSAG